MNFSIKVQTSARNYLWNFESLSNAFRMCNHVVTFHSRGTKSPYWHESTPLIKFASSPALPNLPSTKGHPTLRNPRRYTKLPSSCLMYSISTQIAPIRANRSPLRGLNRIPSNVLLLWMKKRVCRARFKSNPYLHKFIENIFVFSVAWSHSAFVESS